MALNKIFIHKKDLSYSEVNESGSDITFIREDALLEWAKNMKQICKGAEPIEKAYQTMIDKIESL